MGNLYGSMLLLISDFSILPFPSIFEIIIINNKKSEDFNSRFQQLLKTQPGPGEIFSRFRRDVEGITFEDRIESCIIILKNI